MTAQLALVIVGCIFSALLTFAVFYLREIKSGFEKGQARQDEAIHKLQERLNELPEKYVFRDDFVRWSISIDKKIDDVAKDLKRLIEREGKTCQQ